MRSARLVAFAIVFVFAAADVHAGECHANGHWAGATATGWRLELQIDTKDGDIVALGDMPDVGGYNKRFTGRIDSCHMHVERPQPGRAPVVIDGTFSSDRLNATLEMFGRKSEVAMRRTSGDLRPIRRREVTFRNGDVTLAGSLILPEKKATYGAVVFAHGAGPETRSTSESLAILLARAGIASLVYDKRGTGASTGEWETASIDDLAGDLVAAVACAGRESEIDPHRIGIYGYSQGGWITPRAAARAPHAIAFVIAGGLSAVNPMEQTIHHRTGVMRREHVDAATIDRAMSLWRQLYRSRSIEERAAMQTLLKSVASEPWFAASGLPSEITPEIAPGVAEFLRYDPMPDWAQIHQPVFFFWGSDDINVPVRDSLRMLSTTLASDDVTVRIYPEMAHELTIPSADLPRIESRVYADVRQWITDRFTAQPA